MNKELIIRLESENSALKQKLTKLGDFLDSKDKLEKVDPIQVSLLKCQFAVMMSYSEILNQRIALLNSK